METTTTIKTQVYNLVILDKSGSMHSIRQQAIDGFNETLGSIRAAQLKHQNSQEQFVSLAVFCGCGVDMIYDKTPIKDAENLKPEQYEPCCCTPLYDAIGMTVQKLKKDIKDVPDAAVIVTIITDGYENASTEWNGPTIKKLIDDCKQDGWVFAFIGAGADIIRVAGTISIDNTLLWEKTAEGTDAMFKRSAKAGNRIYNQIACLKEPLSERKKELRFLASNYFAEEDKEE